MTVLVWPSKDPNEVLDYAIDYGRRLDPNDTITTSTWEVTGNTSLATQSTSHSDTKTTVWLAGGTLGMTYLLTNHITTQYLRTMDQSVRLSVEAK